MHYTSTRDAKKSFNSADVIKAGISPDGGLFLPEYIPKMSKSQLQHMIDKDYRGRASDIMQMFLTDFKEQEIGAMISTAYHPAKFDDELIAPLRQLNQNTHILELWHGPTCAFKDMALQVLPHLLVRSAQKTGDASTFVILVATSGDTGKAALEGFADVSGTRIIVFYPEQGVSTMQKLQMITQKGDNVAVIGVAGNFDDAQTGVKAIFNDRGFNERLSERSIKLSSANSINWGRLLPQIVYYVSAYVDLVKSGHIKMGEKVNVVVPTGNFGNILAAYYAREMGIPIGKLICASNANKVLTDFIRTGVYDRRRDLKKTISPSMDILVSSNLERLLFELYNRDDHKIRQMMQLLMEKGVYQIDTPVLEKLQSIFYANYADDYATMKSIKITYDKYHYVVDTHTAVGLKVLEDYRKETGDETIAVVASTASPYKFPKSVLSALNVPIEADQDEFSLLEILSDISRLAIPDSLKKLKGAEIRHKTVCKKDEMKETVANTLSV
ncbi:threonine synthase [Caldanaerobius polysaccharolyticus]|uniref:threonine synthase n=1 Tax=Caldanaerobius polysaccharolyticus TaxID=44256 RepID=UPI00047C3B5F|nr:threonine synthase [Caldanaerobius polysaccharolyticus]